MNKKLSIEMFSNLDFDGMVIDINCNMENIASINYDKGIDNLEIEIHPISEKLILPLNEFLLILKRAKQLAIQCAEEDEERKNE